jgi:hypothetical protein
VRSPDVSCWNCPHRAVLSADRWPDDVPVPAFGPRMVCTSCGIVGGDARPNWQEQPQRETLRPVASRRFQRSMTSSASTRATRSALSFAAPALMSSPRP